jgi:hypothetical protein
MLSRFYIFLHRFTAFLKKSGAKKNPFFKKKRCQKHSFLLLFTAFYATFFERSKDDFDATFFERSKDDFDVTFFLFLKPLFSKVAKWQSGIKR